MIAKLMTGSLVLVAAGLLLHASVAADTGASRPSSKVFTMKPVGQIHKSENAVEIEIDRPFKDALKGLEDFSHVWVFWWFDRNDTPDKRQILQVHPRGNARNPLTGVFATRAPVRPNLIGLTLCRIESITDSRIRVADIDAFDGTPVLDLKPYLPSCDHATEVKLPEWVGSTRGP